MRTNVRIVRARPMSVVRRIVSVQRLAVNQNHGEIFLPPLVSGSPAGVTYFVVERVHRLLCSLRRPHVVLFVLAWPLHVHPRIFRALVPNSASCKHRLVLHLKVL